MKRLFAWILLVGIGVLSGGMSGPHASFGMPMAHAATQDMHTMAVDMESIVPETSPVCGFETFACFVVCQSGGTSVAPVSVSGTNFLKLSLEAVDDRGGDVPEECLSNHELSSFSPPDDPGRLLAVMKRE